MLSSSYDETSINRRLKFCSSWMYDHNLSQKILGFDGTRKDVADDLVLMIALKFNRGISGPYLVVEQYQ